MSWLLKLLGCDERKAEIDVETVEKTRRKKLEFYRSIKGFALKEGDRELLEFAKNRENSMLNMLEDEYDVIKSGRR